MAKWINKNGDTIETNGAIYTVTKNGTSTTTDISKWTYNAEAWINNDIKAGYYNGYKKLEA